MNKKIVFAFVLLCCTLLVPLTAMQAVEAYRFKPVRVMLHSPVPDKRPVRRERAIELEQKRSECSKTFIMPDQTQVIRAYQ
jgi:hypothetical protein